MRTELLVIVAIIFLCSWCVYILVKMNVTVGNHQVSKNQSSPAPDYRLEPSKSIYHSSHSNPPYRIHSNIADNQSNYASIYAPNHRPFYLQRGNIASNSDYDYDYKDKQASDRQNQHLFIFDPVNAARKLHNERSNNQMMRFLGSRGPPSTNIDIDVTRPKFDTNRYHGTDGNKFRQHESYRPEENRNHQNHSYQASSIASNGLRAIPSKSHAMDKQYDESQESASNYIGRLDSGGNAKNQTDDEDEQSDKDDPGGGSGDDEGAELDERSGGTLYSEQENEAHDNGNNNSQPSQSNLQKKDDETSESDKDYPDNLAVPTKSTVDAVGPKIVSDEDYYEDYQDPITANKQDSDEYDSQERPKSRNKDKDSHEHKMKESVVSQRWNDGDDSKSDDALVAEPINLKKARAAKINGDDDETVKFLDLDKFGEPFANKRFKRQSHDSDFLGNSGFLNMTVPNTRSSSHHDPAIGVQLSDVEMNNINNKQMRFNETDLDNTFDLNPWLGANESSYKVDIPGFYHLPDTNEARNISAAINPHQNTTQTNFAPASNGHQHIEKLWPQYEVREKKKFRQSSRLHPRRLIPIKNHQTSIQPEYIIIENDRATEPSHNYKKKRKKGKGHRSKAYKKTGKNKHFKLHKKEKKKSSKSYKKGDEKKKKHRNQKNKYKKEKGFRGYKKGKKLREGGGIHGGKKGMKFYKDKGYKKNGFRNTYHKEEFGDRKTYFDEFRDKDYKKKWKKFENKHKYNQVKKWSGKDLKKVKKLKDHGQKHRMSGKAKWKKKQSNTHKKTQNYLQHGSNNKKKSYSNKS